MDHPGAVHEFYASRMLCKLAPPPVFEDGSEQLGREDGEGAVARESGRAASESEELNHEQRWASVLGLEGRDPGTHRSWLEGRLAVDAELAETRELEPGSLNVSVPAVQEVGHACEFGLTLGLTTEIGRERIVLTQVIQ